MQGLGEVGRKAGGLGPSQILGQCAGRQGNHRDVTGQGIAVQPRLQVDAAHARQVDVQDHDVWPQVARQGQSFGTCLGDMEAQRSQSRDHLAHQGDV
jgi:hypothetical protein